MSGSDVLRRLTASELDQLHHRLMDRYRQRLGDNLLEIGFGTSERNGKPDRLRGVGVVFHVGKKHSPLREGERIEKQIPIPLPAAVAKRSIQLPSDVVELDPADLELTGREIDHRSDPLASATASAVLVWRLRGEFFFHWSVLTVGHLFWSRRRLPESSESVRVHAGDAILPAQLLLRSPAGSGADIALAEVERQALIDHGLIAAKPSTRGKPIRAIARLPSDRGGEAWSRPRREPVAVRVLRYFPRFFSIPRAGTLFHVMTARSEVEGAFGQGRSGSGWRIERQFAAHQIFAWRGGGYTRGGGQSIHYCLRYLQTELAKLHGVAKPDVTLRIAAYL